MKNKTSPLIFDVKRHSLDDGPGIRTVIFFKGCPLRCVWCHNPESIDPGIEIGFYPSDCIQNIKKDDKPGKELKNICQDCVDVCPKKALKKDAKGRVYIERTLCNRCSDREKPVCVETCPGRALRKIGRDYNLNKLIEIIYRDLEYYKTSKGGVTLSGGEPTMHWDYAKDLLKLLKQLNIPTAIETCGFFKYPKFAEELLSHLDLILFDVKLADPKKHLKYTDQDNKEILENLKKLADYANNNPDKVKVIPRIPLIPGINTDQDNLRCIADKFKNMGIKRCSLLPYNPTWFSKLEAIGKTLTDNLQERGLSEEEMSKIVKLLERGISKEKMLDIRDVFSGMELDWY